MAHLGHPKPSPSTYLTHMSPQQTPTSIKQAGPGPKGSAQVDPTVRDPDPKEDEANGGDEPVMQKCSRPSKSKKRENSTVKSPQNRDEENRTKTKLRTTVRPKRQARGSASEDEEPKTGDRKTTNIKKTTQQGPINKSTEPLRTTRDQRRPNPKPPPDPQRSASKLRKEALVHSKQEMAHVQIQAEATPSKP